MTYTEFYGLLVLGGCLAAMGGWLQLLRAMTGERLLKELAFFAYLAMFAGGMIGLTLDVILPLPSYGPTFFLAGDKYVAIVPRQFSVRGERTQRCLSSQECWRSTISCGQRHIGR